MRTITSIVLVLSAGLAVAKLPPPSDAAKAQMAEAAAKSAWTNKVAAFELCQAQDKVAAAYRKTAGSAGKVASQPSQPPQPMPQPSQASPTPQSPQPSPTPQPSQASPMPPCANPGPYVAAAAAEVPKPLEASGAHSPTETAKSAPSSNATASEIAGGTKK
ncbi:MAG: hypothetical protein ABIS68_03680 [Casimicrobiaceae bacterium]